MDDYPYFYKLPWYGYRSSIKKAIVSDGVTDIGENAFYYCRNLISVTIPSSVTNFGGYDGASAFDGCTGLKSAGPIGSGSDYEFGWTTNIPDHAFDGCSGLESVTIPSSVTSIGEYAFASCSEITKLSIPENATYIGVGAFENCGKLESFVVPNGITTLGGYTFSNCSSLTHIIVPAGLTSFSADVFSGCSGLKSAGPIGGGYNYEFGWTTDIPALAFCHLTSLESVVIPLTVTNIGYDAFYSCAGLSCITIPSSVTTIGSSAFSDCSRLNVTIPSSVTTIEQCAFSGCNSINVELNSSYYSTDSFGALFNKDKSSLIQYPTGNKRAFYAIPDTVARIENDSFEGCACLTDVEIPSSVTYIGQGAFENCIGLTSINIPNSVTGFGDDTFRGCKGLQSVALPNGITYIESNMFYNCACLVNIIIPDSVKDIFCYAFYGCSKLSCVYFQGDAPSVCKASDTSRSFSTTTTLYYISGKSGWNLDSDGKWSGYTVCPVIGGNSTKNHDDAYYKKLPLWEFDFVDNARNRLSQVAVGANGSSISSGDKSTLNVAADLGSDTNVSFSRTDMFPLSLPSAVLSTHNVIAFYPQYGASAYKKPFIQAAYGRHSDGTEYCDLLNGGMQFYAGSLTEKTSLYLNVNWNGYETGKIYLSQTLEPTDGIEVQTGLSDLGNISSLLKSSKPLYLLLVFGGQVNAFLLKATVQSEEQGFKFNTGDSWTLPQPSDNFFSKFELGIDLPDSSKLKLSVESDGTVKGTIGVKVSEEEEESGKVFDALKEALNSKVSDTSGYKKLEDIKDKWLDGTTVQSSRIGIKADSQVIGYCYGKLVHEEDGSIGILFTDFKVGILIEGEVAKTWQLNVEGIPFYVKGSLKAKTTFTVRLYSNKNGTELLTDPIEVKVNVAAKVGAGLGVESILSTGVYGKGELGIEGDIPFDKDSLEVYIQGTFGAEAKAFCFTADVEILKTDKYYLCPLGKAASLAATAEDIAQADWKPLSREYLYAKTGGSASLQEVGENNTVLTASTVKSGVYPYTDVQTASLGDGKQLVVWVEDPGESVRSVANNRTMLYYTYYDGTAWSKPAQVEATDDGTADFNPVLRVLNNKAYVVWQDASRALTADDDNKSSAAVIDLSCAAFNPGAGTFTDLGTVGSSNYDGTADITLIDGAPAIVWTSNSENDVFGQKGTYTLYRAVKAADAWAQTTLADNLGIVDQTAANGDEVWFSADTGTDRTSLVNREIFHYVNGTVTQVTDNNVPDTKPMVTNGKVIWYSNGEISGEDLTNNIPLAESTDRFQYLYSASGMEAVVYTGSEESSDGNFTKTILYASFNDGTGWGDPIVLSGNAGYIESFSAAFLSDGTLSIVASERSLDASGTHGLSQTADLKTYSVKPYCDIAISDASYLQQSLTTGGTLDIPVSIANNGMSAVNLIRLTAKNGTETLVSSVFEASLASGQTEDYSLSVPLGDGAVSYSNITVTAEAVGYSEATDKQADNTATVSLRLNDLSVENTTTSPDDTQVESFVVNRGQTTLNNITVTLYDTDGTTALATKTVASLTSGSGEFVTFDIANTSTDNRLFTVKAVAEGLDPGNENMTANNSANVLLAAVDNSTELTVSGYAVEKDGGFSFIANIKNSTANSVTCKLYIAAYDTNGRMIDVKSVPVDLLATGDSTTAQVDFGAALSSVSRVSIFTLNQGAAPIINAKVYTASDLQS